LVFIYYDGMSFEVQEREIGLLRGEVGERQILYAVASYLDVNYDQVEKLRLERMPSGDILLRPEAICG
jgi:hypothetical protein